MTLYQREVLAWRNAVERLQRGTQALLVEVVPSPDSEAIVLVFRWAKAAYSHKLLLADLIDLTSGNPKVPRCRKIREVCQLVLLQQGV